MKNLIKSILIFVSYFVYDILIKALLYKFHINYYGFDIKYKIITTAIIEITYILLISFLYRKEIKRDIKDFKENYKTYFSKYTIIYLLGVLLMVISNLIIFRITKTNLSGNEELIRTYINKFPIYMIFSSLVYAPIVEELIFRKTIKNIFKSKYLFIITSGLVFGLLHVSEPTFNEYLFSIPYIFMGISFAYIYYKTDNIFTTMTFHMCHNLILLIIQLI